jgi:hypothetical protein
MSFRRATDLKRIRGDVDVIDVIAAGRWQPIRQSGCESIFTTKQVG